MAFSSRKMDSLKGQQFMKKNESVVDADTAFQAILFRRFVSGQLVLYIKDEAKMEDHLNERKRISCLDI